MSMFHDSLRLSDATKHVLATDPERAHSVDFESTIERCIADSALGFGLKNPRSKIRSSSNSRAERG